MQRPIKQEERDLIEYLLSMLPEGSNLHQIPAEVTELNDGGMGSLQLSRNGTLHRDLIQMQYCDSDGQPVLITLTENQASELFDLDIWKVDFSPLKVYPRPEKLKPVL